MSGKFSWKGLVKTVLAAVVAAAVAPFTGCTEAEGEGPPRVVATATMVADMVRTIGGDRVVVEGLMGPGVDPHLYRPSSSDLRRLNRADGIFYMGLYFEEQMQPVFERMRRTRGNTFAVTATIPEEGLLKSEEFPGQIDPHVWFDARLWSHAVDAVIEGLAELDPDGREVFERNGARYREVLLDLDEWLKEKADELPAEKRILVTSHDAYNYFGRAYGFEVVGLLGISTTSEAGLADMTRLVDFIREREVKAIFVESSVSPQAIQRVSRDSGAKVGGELFSDALGAPGDLREGFDVGTYDGMMRYNLTTIVNALK